MLNNPTIIHILFIINLKISIFKAECGIEEPFKREGGSCSPIICDEGEENCSIDNSIIRTQWLNNIFIFNDENYRYGSFALNENGDLVIEYSYNNKRLFFGLRSNGDFYFGNKPTKKIEIENEDNYIRNHSKLIFVTDNDNQKNIYLIQDLKKQQQSYLI